MSHRAASNLHRLWIVRLALTGTLLVIVLLLVATGLLLHRPAWTQSHLSTEADVKQRGGDLENAVVRELTRVRPAADPNGQTSQRGRAGVDSTLAYASEPWSVSIMESDLNAWLVGRLPDWLQSREVTMPDSISRVCIRLEDNAAYIAAEYSGPVTLVLTQPVFVDVNTEGQLSIQFGSITSGLLPLPGLHITGFLPEKLLEMALGHMNPDHREHAKMSSASLIRIPKALIGLEDGRSVRILDFTIQQGRLEVTCQTEK